MYKLFLIAVIGYLTAASGFFMGVVATIVSDGRDKRFRGALMGFTGGVLIAFVCFEILANALKISGIYVGMAGALAGVLFTLYLETRLKKTTLSVAIILCAAIVFDSIPEGIALGSMLNHSLKSGVMFAVILALHCLPEGLAAAAYMKRGRVSNPRMILSAFLLAIPMGLSALAGGALSKVSPYILSISLSLAGGVMLYITCGEILPDSKENSGTVTALLTAAAGFAIGSLIVGKF